MDGLIDAAFDQLQDLRDGIASAHETIAFAKTADLIVRGVEADLKRAALVYAHEQRMRELENRKLEITYGIETEDGSGDQEDGGEGGGRYEAEEMGSGGKGQQDREGLSSEQSFDNQ